MSRTAPLPLRAALVALALAAAPAATLLASPAAHAQAPTFDGPIVEVLPPGDVVADGTTPVALRILALNPDGSPLTDLTGRIVVTAGNAAKIEPVGDGVYQASFTPDAVKKIETLKLSMKAKTSAGVIDREVTVRVVPPNARVIGVRANPNRIVLGQDATANLTFNFRGDLADAADAGVLEVRTSSGTVANMTPLGDGRYSALYTAPKELFPHNAIITVVDRRDPTRSFGSTTLPLVGKANFPVQGLPNSRILMKIGDREFGPIQADATGKAQIPIEVLPGVPKATVTSLIPGQPKKEEVIDLQIPVTKRVQLFPTWAAIPADGATPQAVRAHIAKPDGAPDTNASVRFSVTAGAVGPITHEGDGVYVAQYTPPMGKVPSTATLQVTVDDPTGPQTDALNISLVPALPARLSLTPEPPTLAGNVAAIQVFAKVAGRDGGAGAAQGLRLDVAGGALQGATKDLGAGDFQATVAPDGGGALDILGTVRAAASGNPLAHVLVVPARDVVRPDGRSTTGVAILTVDAFGHPVGGVPVQLRVASGDAGLPASITTDDAGIGVVPLTSGQALGAIRIQAVAGTHQGEALVLQGPKGLRELQLPVSGTAASQGVQVNWDALSEAALVRKAGGSAVAAAPLTTPAGVPARVVVASQPASAPAGSAATLSIQIFDAGNRPVPGQPLQFVSSAGAVTGLQDLGGGNYTATLTIPPETPAGEVKVTAITPAGIAGLLAIPVGPAVAAVPGWGATAPAQPEQPAQPEPPKEPKEPKAKKEQGEFPWLRAGAGFLGGLYSYQQTPSTQQGPLYSETITVGGQVTSPAGAAGLYVDGRAFLPMFEYVGFDAAFRTVQWSMIFPGQAFEDPIPDWLNQGSLSAIGRYPFEINETSRVHIGGRLGFDVNDFLYFTQESVGGDGAFDVVYQQLPVFSTAFGAEVAGEFGPVFALLAYEAGFSDFSGLYSNELDTELGVELGQRAYLSGRFGLQSRTSPVYQSDGTQEVGTLTDSLTSFGLGGGVQF